MWLKCKNSGWFWFMNHYFLPFFACTWKSIYGHFLYQNSIGGLLFYYKWQNSIGGLFSDWEMALPWWPIFVLMRRVTSENKQPAMLNVAYGGGTLMVAITETISGATYWAQLATVHWSQSLTGPWQFGGIVWRLADHNGNMSPVTDGGWGLKYFVCLCSLFTCPDTKW